MMNLRCMRFFPKFLKRNNRMPVTRRAKCKRNQRGGSLGNTYGFTPSSYGGSGTIANPLTWSTSSSCVGEARPGFMAAGFTGAKGLPGMSGGKRRNASKLKKQSGGRYGFDGSNLTGVGAPWGSARASVEHVPCEASRSSVPDSGAAGMLNKTGGPLWDGPRQMGGANPAIASALSSAVYEAPTAGYTHLRNGADSIQTSAGTLEMINVPQHARMMSPACLKTGGSRRKSRKTSRKSRKASRKSRKGSRKQ